MSGIQAHSPLLKSFPLYSTRDAATCVSLLVCGHGVGISYVFLFCVSV